MVEILKKIERVDDRLDYVLINHQAIEKLTSTIHAEDLKVSEISLSHYKWDKESLVNLVFAFNSVNFCFWADKDHPKWTMTFGEEQMDGSIALFRAFEEELKTNQKFVSGENLAKLNVHSLAKILKGNVEIPLFNERLLNLNEVGKVLVKKYNGSFLNLINTCGNDSINITSSVISDFPSFFDEEKYKGKEIPFYKRAQLNTKMISDVLISLGEKPLDNLNRLAAFADYKIPQLLRSLGVLEYKPGLASDIDNLVIIKKGSPEEVEIRIATILAVEKMKQNLLKKYEWVTSSHIDSMLWNKSQDKRIKVKPYHRTYTTSY